MHISSALAIVEDFQLYRRGQPPYEYGQDGEACFKISPRDIGLALDEILLFVNLRMSLTDKLTELENLKQNADRLEQEVVHERIVALNALTAQYGYDSMESFIKAVKQAASGTAPKKGRAKRTKITEQLKIDIAAAAANLRTNAEISAMFGVSVATVQNIKKEAGLVKSRAQ